MGKPVAKAGTIDNIHYSLVVDSTEIVACVSTREGRKYENTFTYLPSAEGWIQQKVKNLKNMYV